eukprot:scaffold2771_cov252-Pinguiococcus_pyrenoidosus.AAC.47
MQAWLLTNSIFLFACSTRKQSAQLTADRTSDVDEPMAASRLRTWRKKPRKPRKGEPSARARKVWGARKSLLASSGREAASPLLCAPRLSLERASRSAPEGVSEAREPSFLRSRLGTHSASPFGRRTAPPVPFFSVSPGRLRGSRRSSASCEEFRARPCPEQAHASRRLDTAVRRLLPPEPTCDVDQRVRIDEEEVRL